MKELNFFNPIEELGVEESERHYRAVHSAFARRLFRGAPDVERYTPFLILGQRDLLGGFAQRPDYWRLVLMQFSSEDYLASDVGERVMLDHWNCLQDIASFRVRDTVLHDALNGQTSCSTHLVAVPTGRDVLASDDQLDALTRRFAGAFGARVLTHNRVESLRGTQDRGRRLTQELIHDTPYSTFVELAFDNPEWAEEFLRDPEVEHLLGLDVPGGSRAYALREEPGIDRR